MSRNNFVVQLTSDLLGRSVERPKDVDMTVYGAIYVAGLAHGFWKSRDEIKQFWELDRRFDPKDPSLKEGREILQHYKTWQKAVERSLGWYKQMDNGNSPERAENPEINEQS